MEHWEPGDEIIIPKGKADEIVRIIKELRNYLEIQDAITLVVQTVAYQNAWIKDGPYAGQWFCIWYEYHDCVYGPSRSGRHSEWRHKESIILDTEPGAPRENPSLRQQVNREGPEL